MLGYSHCEKPLRVWILMNTPMAVYHHNPYILEYDPSNLVTFVLSEAGYSLCKRYVFQCKTAGSKPKNPRDTRDFSHRAGQSTWNRSPSGSFAGSYNIYWKTIMKVKNLHFEDDNHDCCFHFPLPYCCRKLRSKGMDKEKAATPSAAEKTTLNFLQVRRLCPSLHDIT